MNEDQGAAYLQAFGYLEKAQNDFQAAVRLFQEHFGTLEQDGVLGPKTLRAMATPRCGLAEQTEEANILRKWPSRDFLKDPLTVRVEQYVDGLSKTDQKNIFIAGLEGWERVCGVQFKLVDGNSADITISAGRGRADSFDSAGGTLAWAQLPDGRSGSPLLMKFDLDENWIAQRGQRGILLLNVFAHEGGHLLGLSHSNASSDLMAPFYSESIGAPQRGDISEVVKRYGQPVVVPGPSNPPPGDDETVTLQVKRSGLTIPGYRLSKVA